ncbi:ATP-dependent DNA helicase DinG [Halobacillus litoralis]|uniref:3'-5' exonuclease DinG n=1 Tax=Halobacillus litoralis TaxID=45668 RepID=A0A410M769_9BACI|nr:ATP-dependent DNA helicase DinG [Halobacillus litoralis]QAS50808.1 ATP-dependent helicase DinG [Halobacillus litoralis]
MTTFAIVDLETTGNSASKGDRIIEIGIVVMNEEGSVVEEFSSLVYPEREIPPFITSLTGIEDEDVLEAPLFSEIAEDIYPLFQNGYIVAHNIEFDLSFLNDELARCGYQPLHNPIIDTVEFSRIMLPTSPTYKLGQLADHLNMGHDRPHRALSDAQVTADLLAYLLKELKSLPERTLVHLLKVESKLKSDLRPFIQLNIDQKRYGQITDPDIDIRHGISVRKQTNLRTTAPINLPSFESWKKDVYEGENGLKSLLDNFENRQGQQEMTTNVHEAFEQDKHAVIEAGAGTGKSVAYLLTASYHALQHDSRVVITTHTTSLQKQLLEDEIPKVERMFPRPIKAVLYKGKSHYISLVHFHYELENSYQDNYDVALTKAMILVWLTTTRTGDVDEIQLPSNGRQFWHKVSAEQSSKSVQLGYVDDSFYQWAQQKALHADLVITNHALFCMDIMKEESILPEYDRVVIDEAHHLESVSSRYFGVRMNYKEIQRHLTQFGEIFHKSVYRQWPLQREFHQYLERGQYAIDEAKEELSHLSRFIYQNVKKQKNLKGKSDVGRIQLVLKPEEMPSFMTTAKEMSYRFLASLQKLSHEMSKIEEQLRGLLSLKEDEGVPILLTRLHTHRELCQTIRSQLIHYFDFVREGEVKWVEIEGEGAANSIYLFSEPFDIARLLNQRLFQVKKSVILTSATLATDHSFTYIRDTLGLIDDERTLEVNIPSPYNYKNQVQLMVPNDFPNVKEDPDAFIEAISEAIYSVAEVTRGRMLVLFTSYDMLRKTYHLLRDFIDPEEFMIFAQGISSGSRDRLKKNFQAFDQAILLGTSSFWEGVDIPGDDLSCLMMVRLPFQPPDQPVQSIRNERMKKEGKNSFMEKSLPHAIIRFKQGFGRLIRSNKDRGIVFICDTRLMEARYGKYFLSSLPDVPVSYKSTRQLINQIEDWL